MQKVKILIIDDEQEICEFSKLVLEKTDRFEVRFSTVAVKGIDMAKSYKPDLILLDLVLPDIDGSEVAERLLQDSETKNIPVAFLTALAKRDEVDRHSGKIGDRFFIAKPVSPQELVNHIDDILNIKSISRYESQKKQRQSGM